MQSRIDIATRVDKEVRMHSDSVAEAENFLERWRQAQYLLIREGIAGVVPNAEVQRLRGDATQAGMLPRDERI